MTWGRIDDNMAFHPKVVAAGNECVGARDRMISYCSDHRTDGWIQHEIVLAICGKSSLVRRLVQHRMLDVFEPDSDGKPGSKVTPEDAPKRRFGPKLFYYVHNFPRYNPTAYETNVSKGELSQKRAEAGRKGAAAKWGKSSSLPSELPVDLPSENDGNLPMANGWQFANGKDGPSPDPDPFKREEITRADQVIQSAIKKFDLEIPGLDYQTRIKSVLPMDRDRLDKALEKTAGANFPNWKYFVQCLEKPIENPIPSRARASPRHGGPAPDFSDIARDIEKYRAEEAAKNAKR